MGLTPWPRFSKGMVRRDDRGCCSGDLLAGLAPPGCGQAKIDFTDDAKPPTVSLIQPPVRNIVRVVGQPSFIESYRAHVDLSQAERLHPEVDRGHRRQGEEERRARDPVRTRAGSRSWRRRRRPSCSIGSGSRWPSKQVEVAKADVTAAEARLKEAEEILNKYQAEVDRWDTEVKRLERQVASVVIDRRVLFESTNQLKSSIAARDKAKATIKRAKAELLFAQASLAKARVEVRVAEADLKVAESEERYAQGVGRLPDAQGPV